MCPTWGRPHDDGLLNDFLLKEGNPLESLETTPDIQNPVWGRSHFPHIFPLQNAHFGQQIANIENINNMTKNTFGTNFGSHSIAPGEDDPKTFFYGDGCRNLGSPKKSIWQWSSPDVNSGPLSAWPPEAPELDGHFFLHTSAATWHFNFCSRF